MVVLLFDQSCKKAHIKRHYTGNFLFNVHYTSTDANLNHSDTTYFYHGNISIYNGKGTSEEENKKLVFLTLSYAAGHGISEEILKDGHFVTDYYLRGEFSGAFSDDDNLSFSESNGGQGSSYSYTVTGTRE
ncbi:hypothetical protein BH11BAC7_BH11BAC7_34050 [soil metagenome]